MKKRQNKEANFLNEKAAVSAEEPKASIPLNLKELTASIGQVALMEGAHKFPFFYARFLRELDSCFKDAHQSNLSLFLREVEQNKFQAFDPEIGQLETKNFEGRVGIRFVPVIQHAKTPLTIVIINVPLAANSHSAPMGMRAEQRKAGRDDTCIGSKQFGRYISNLLINTRVTLSLIHFAKVWRFTARHRNVFVVDQFGSGTLDSEFFPAVRWGTPRYWRHFAKATFKEVSYGDVFRGTTFGMLTFAMVAMSAALSPALHPGAQTMIWGPAIASFIYVWVLATGMDSYAPFLKRGDNRNWETIKRLIVGALYAYPISVMQADWDWSVLFTWKTTMLVWVIGMGDRYLATVMIVVPNLHSKYYLKPWFFPVRMKVPFRGLASRLMNDPKIMGSTMKGVNSTREVLALPRFGIKFLGLFLDPLLMKYTSGIPVVTISLWSMAIPFEIFNYFSIKKLAHENPQTAEEFIEFKRRWWIELPTALLALFPMKRRQDR